MGDIPINLNDARIQYTAVGAQTAFDYDFPIFDQADLVVLQTVKLTGLTSTLTITTHYTLSGVGAENGGTVTLVAGAAADDIITIERNVPFARSTDFQARGSYEASAINRELDLMAMMLQQLGRDRDRGFRIPKQDPIAALDLLPDVDGRKGKVLGFDADGQPFMGPTIDDILTTIATAFNTGSSAAAVTYLPAGVGAVARTVQDKLREAVSVLDFIPPSEHAAIMDGTSTFDTTTGFQAAIDTGNYVVPQGKYKITSTLTVTGGKVGWFENPIIDKAFDGEGMVFTGGATFNDIHGQFTMDKLSFNPGTGSVVSNNSADHGVVFRGNRVRQFGQITSQHHQGDGFRFDATSNANKSFFNHLRGVRNNSRGAGFSGTVDDSSVWRISLYTENNFAGGIFIPDDYPARNWDAFFYNESSGQDGTSHGVYLGGMNNGVAWIYSEEQTSSGDELHIPAAASNLWIWDVRANRTVNLGADCVIRDGGIQRAPGSTPTEGDIRAANVTDNAAKYIERRWFGSANFELLRRRVLGTGTIQWLATRRADGSNSTFQIVAGVGIKIDGVLISDSGTTASRPSASSTGVGSRFFDTTLNKPVYSDGTNWRDAAGVVV